MLRNVLLVTACLVGLMSWSWSAGGEQQASSPLPAAASFELVGENPTVRGERRQVMRFYADGLEQFALVLWPAGALPEDGWPVLLFNHGFHPDPPQYGRTEQGVNDRPGDYYRSVPQAFVDRGFVVVAPDFRGHNDSAGFEYTQHEQAPLFYASDSIAAFRAMDSLENLDLSRRYMLGHSMGGLVTLAALAELGDEVIAASIWSTMAATEDIKPTALSGVPLMIQHAREDAVTSASGSERIAEILRSQDHDVYLHLFDSADHLFTGAQLENAVVRDLKWFARYRN